MSMCTIFVHIYSLCTNKQLKLFVIGEKLYNCQEMRSLVSKHTHYILVILTEHAHETGNNRTRIVLITQQL